MKKSVIMTLLFIIIILFKPTYCFAADQTTTGNNVAESPTSTPAAASISVNGTSLPQSVDINNLIQKKATTSSSSMIAGLNLGAIGTKFKTLCIAGVNFIEYILLIAVVVLILFTVVNGIFALLGGGIEEKKKVGLGIFLTLLALFASQVALPYLVTTIK